MGAVVVVTAGLLFGGATAAYAAVETFTVGSFTFSADSANVSAGATITATTGAGAITIPATVTSGSFTYDVTTIGENLFFGRSVESVTIPNSVTTISEGAFRRAGLESVTIPDSVITIGDLAFSYNNDSLRSVTIGNSVTTIGAEAFAGNLLTSVTIGTGVTAIGGGAFADNPLAWFLVPASVTDVAVAPLCNSGARTVTFDSVEGSAVSRAIACSALAVPTPVAPTRTGFTLTGWSAQLSGGDLFNFSSPVTANTTLFAQWSAPSHSVTFNSQGGSDVTARSYLAGGSVALPAAPTRAGFTFAGWFVAASGGTALVSPYSPPGTGAITLFAQWTAVPAAAAPSAPSALAATGASLPLAAPMGMAMLLLAAGGFALLASRRRVGRRA
jgi:uncharacterized repeat protein (TIGR02543 family)